MKKTLAFLFVAALAGAAFAQKPEEINVSHGNAFMHVSNFAGGGGSGNLVYHNGGVVIPVAHVVDIFWGPSFASGGADNGYATTLQAFRNNFGTTGEFNVITQYYQVVGGTQTNIQLSNLALGTSDWFDTSQPPTNVTDADVQAEVQRYLQNGHATDYSAIYEVFIPSTSYSSSGTSDSCGGPNLAYCAYHSHYNDGTGAVKYSIEPYPSCSGCQASGFNTVQNQEHFVCHETREAVSDPLGNAWFDRRGNEADDKCAWSPAPFISGGYGYQYEWSNANSACVQTR